MSCYGYVNWMAHHDFGVLRYRILMYKEPYGDCTIQNGGRLRIVGTAVYTLGQGTPVPQDRGVPSTLPDY